MLSSILPARRVSTAEDPLPNGKGLNQGENVGDLYYPFFGRGNK